jgi:NADH-ubiquinone oxidoreductase chain 3
MSSFSILFIFVAIVVLALLALNFLLAPRNPYFEKQSAFECGFHSFQQSRSQFHLSFFMYAIVYLIFDLEIVLLYPYAVSTYENGLYGLVIMLIFTFIITIGFVYELSSGALEIDSRQNSFAPSVDSKNPHLLLTSSFIPKGAHL